MFGQAFGVAGDLHDQFARGRDNQRAGFTHEALIRRKRCFQQLGDGRDQEGGRFAGAGLGAADGIVPAQGTAQQPELRAVAEALILNGAHQAVWQRSRERGLAFGGGTLKVVDAPCLAGAGFVGRSLTLGLTRFASWEGALSACRSVGGGLTGRLLDRLRRFFCLLIAFSVLAAACLDYMEIEDQQVMQGRAIAKLAVAFEQ